MTITSTQLSYSDTGAFSKILTDYVENPTGLRDFFEHTCDLEGIKSAIAARQSHSINREVLVRELRKQYEDIPASEKSIVNIDSLLHHHTFTITTAHQNNLFTGPLYFIYKILHAIRLADELQAKVPEYKFVPVYYMGSEDADLDELNHIRIDGNEIIWHTEQKGAVGRMRIDKELITLINRINGQIGVLPAGPSIVERLLEFYTEGRTIQEATFRFVNFLFSDYGLVILLPDNRELKRQASAIFEDDLIHQHAAGIVEETGQRLKAAGYKIQAHPREINLFYLDEQLRERIEREGDEWTVVNTDKRFTREQLQELLTHSPGHLSPNVILRGIFQETILPNIAFIGGGGELAYWLQLKDLFEYYKVPFPVLVVRNSFLLLEEKWRNKWTKTGFTPEQLFMPVNELLRLLVKNEKGDSVSLEYGLVEMEKLYDYFRNIAKDADATLGNHVDALQHKTMERLKQLEKKIMRAEKKKLTAQEHQLNTIKSNLFPGNGLQERSENILGFYARYGKSIIDTIYNASPALEQKFTLLYL